MQRPSRVYTDARFIRAEKEEKVGQNINLGHGRLGQMSLFVWHFGTSKTDQLVEMNVGHLTPLVGLQL